MAAMKIECRSTQAPGFSPSVSTRAGGGSVIVGYGAVFYDGTPGTQYEIWANTFERIMPGAFARAIREKDNAAGLFNHDMNLILGRVSAGTLRLKEDAKGLRYEIDVPDSPVGQTVLEAVRRGDVSGSSFSFVIEDERWRKEGTTQIREVLAVRLYDVAPVVYPAYQATTAGLRAIDPPQRIREIEAEVTRNRMREVEADQVRERVRQIEADVVRGRMRQIERDQELLLRRVIRDRFGRTTV